MNNSISVVIPTHNRPEGLAAAVKSVFNQTLLPKELIVVDDGSNPPVSKDVFAGCPGGLTAKLFRNESPKGANNARNRGIKEATGDWVAFLDDDDAFVSEKLQTVHQYIKNNPEVDLFYHPATIFFSKEKIRYQSNPGEIMANKSAFAQLALRNEIGGTSMVIAKTSSLKQAGMFSLDLPAIEDFELWLKLAKQNACFFLINLPLTNYYHHTSKSSLTKSFEKRRAAFDIIETKFKSDFEKLTKEQFNQYKIRGLKSEVFIALLNYQKSLAFKKQLAVLSKTLKVKDVLLLFAIIIGPKFVIKMRSL